MKDERMWMRFPIAFDEDPTIAPLSDAAFRAFVAMNGYSRRNDLDGRIPARAAIAKWGDVVLSELIDARPDSPIVALEADTYVLTKYDKHQFTTEDAEKLRTSKAEAGRAGGKASAVARASKREASAEAPAGQVLKQDATTGQRGVKQNEAESESEIDLTSDITHHHLSVTEVDARENADGDLIDHLRKKALVEADRLHIADLTDVRDWLEKASGRTLNLGEAVELAGDIIGRSKNPVESGDRYVIGTCRKSPGRVAAYADALDLGVVA